MNTRQRFAFALIARVRAQARDGRPRRVAPAHRRPAAAPREAGESFVIPAGVVHDAQNDTAKPVKLLGVYVVEKGKPLATPAP